MRLLTSVLLPLTLLTTALATAVPQTPATDTLLTRDNTLFTRDDSAAAASCPKRLFHDESRCNHQYPGQKRCKEAEVRGPEGTPIKGWKCACAVGLVLRAAESVPGSVVSGDSGVVERDDGLDDRDGMVDTAAVCPVGTFYRQEKTCNRRCPGLKLCDRVRTDGPNGSKIKVWKCPCW